MSPALEGKTIEYLDGGQLKLAQVEHEAKSKLQVTDERGRNESVAPSRVVIVHSERSQPGSFPNLARQLRSRIEQIQDEIDLELLWQSVEASAREYKLDELAAVYFSEVTPLHLSALFRSLDQDQLYFRRKNFSFTPRSGQALEELRHQLLQRQEREAFRDRAIDWIRTSLGADGPIATPPEFQDLLNRAYDFLMGKPVGELPQLLARAVDELTGREAAFQLLVKTGGLPANADPLLVIAGIEERFRPKVSRAAEEIVPFEATPDRTDFSHLLSFSIDDDETQEIDDALTVEREGDLLRVGIHIADVSYFIPKGGIIDDEAKRRGVTVYLPTGTLPMFPERLAFDLMSLGAGRLRPTLSFLVSLDPGGEVRSFDVIRGMLRVGHRLNYCQADRLIEEISAVEGLGASVPSEQSLAAALKDLYAVALKLSAGRLGQGALIIRRPELKIRVENEKVSVKTIDSNAPSRTLVSEMMILANAMAARAAYTQDLPVIYRAQENNLEPDNEMVRQLSVSGSYDPLLFDRIMRNMRRSKLSLFPQPHGGLGLAAYIQLTSPIRRYADLVIQRQFAARIQGSPPPYEREELLEVLGSAEAAEREIRAIEQQSDRRWVLEYMAQELSGRTLLGTVIDQVARGFTVEIDELFIRGLMSPNRVHKPGDRVKVVIDSIQSDQGRLKLRELT